MKKMFKQSLALLLVFALLFTASSGMGAFANEAVAAYELAAAIAPVSALPGNRVSGSVQFDQSYMIRNVQTGLFLTATEPTYRTRPILSNFYLGYVQIQPFSGANDQVWMVSDERSSIWGWSGVVINSVPNPYFMLVQGRYSSHNPSTGLEINIRREHSTPTNFMWHFDYQNNGQFRIRAERRSLALNTMILGLTDNNSDVVLRGEDNLASRQWEIIEPTRVSFNIAENHGIGTPPPHRDLFEGTVLTPAFMPTAEKTNSVFVGWHTDPTATTPLQSFTVGSENVTLYAIFRDSHPVTYNAQHNGGAGASTNAPNNLRLFAGDPVNLDFVAERDNARFLGWHYDPDAATGLTAHPMSNNPLTLFAIFLNQQQLTFNVNGGGNLSQASAMVFPGDLVDLSPTATVEYGRFLGWHTDPNSPEPLPYFYMPNTDYTLFAIFEMQQTVTFESIDGTSVTRNTFRYFAGDAVNLSRTATREHARFLGWNTTPNARPPLTSFTMPSGNATLYAIFDDALFLNFNHLANGGNGVSQAVGRYFEGDVVDLTNYTATREHARFLGWSDQPTGAPLLTSFTMQSSNTTLYAIFEDSIVLTFNYRYNEGTGVSREYARFFAGEPVDLSPIATKPGWEFVGWNTYENRNASTVLTEFGMPNEPIRLYAIFRLTSVVTFIDYNDSGRQTRTVTIITYNRDVPRSVTPPAQHNRTGWVTHGWTALRSADAHPLSAGDFQLLHPNSLPSDVPFATHVFYGLYQSPVVLSYIAEGAVVTPSFVQHMRIINSYDSSAPHNPRFWIAGPPLRVGFYLVEWTTGSESFQPDQRFVFGEDTLLTAVWAPGVATVRVPVTGITLSAPAPLNVGDRLQLIATVLPLNATARGVDWHSDNLAVATVDEYGNVTARSIGTVVITATTAEGNFSATATITVAPVELSGIALSHSNETITVGQFLHLEAIFLPGNATNRNVTWSSNNLAIAMVDQTGRVHGRAIGDAIITVTAANGMTASMSVTVAPIRVENAVLSLPSTVLHVGDVRMIDIDITPTNATNQTIMWSSSSDAVSVDAEGRVRANRLGVATITATIDGQQFSISVDVRPILVTDITLVPNEAAIVMGNTRRIHIGFEPHNAVNANFVWSTSAASIATVDAEGLVTARGIGTAIITARTLDGTVAATARITVLPILVERMSVNINAITLRQGETQQIRATVSPANATNREVTWRSSNTAVATVDQNGRVSARASGTAIIIATARDGSNATASTTITVPPRLVHAFQPSHGAVSATIGDQFPLTVRVLPADACNPAYRVTVSNSRIIRYDNGVITTLAHGEAYVTFTALDGSGITARTRIVVHPPVLVERIILPSDTMTLNVGESMALPTAVAIPSYASNGELAVLVSDSAILRYANGTLTRLASGEAFVAIAATDGGGAFAIVLVMETPQPTSAVQAFWNAVVDVMAAAFTAAMQIVSDLIAQIAGIFSGHRSDTTGVAWPFHNTGTAGQVNPVEDIWISGFGWVPAPWGVNSYLYAINVRTAPLYAPDDGLLIQRYANLASVRDAVLADVQSRGRSIRIIDGADAPIHPSSEYRFALRVGQNPLVHNGIVLGNVWDYHFMVQTDTGAWAHKQGWYQRATLAGYIDPATAYWPLEFDYEFNGNVYTASFENFFNSNTIFFAATRNDNY